MPLCTYQTQSQKGDEERSSEHFVSGSGGILVSKTIEMGEQYLPKSFLPSILMVRVIAAFEMSMANFYGVLGFFLLW